MTTMNTEQTIILPKLESLNGSQQAYIATIISNIEQYGLNATGQRPVKNALFFLKNTGIAPEVAGALAEKQVIEKAEKLGKR